MSRRVQQFRSQNSSSNIGGRLRTSSTPPPPPPPSPEDALLLDGDTGFLLQETSDQILLDK